MFGNTDNNNNNRVKNLDSEMGNADSSRWTRKAYSDDELRKELLWTDDDIKGLEKKDN